jgi:hypothetical protein
MMLSETRSATHRITAETGFGWKPWVQKEAGGGRLNSRGLSLLCEPVRNTALNQFWTPHCRQTMPVAIISA